jgi:membrane protease YdiL (CAAX protease family)
VANGNSKSWELRLPIAFAVWVPIVVFVILLGFRLGYGGRRYGITLSVAAVLFAFEFFLACPSVLERARKFLGGHGRVLAPLVPLFAVLFYTTTVTGKWTWALAGAAYCVVPALLLASSAGEPPGSWEDYAAALIVWLPVEFRWMYHLFPYPTELSHTLTILLALSTGIAAFVLLRRMDGIGYEIVWRRGFGVNAAIHFLIFVAIAVPLGMHLGFLKFDPAVARLRSLPLATVGITFFTAWPEEFLFRGVLQNLLSRTLKNQWTGLAITAVIFGFSHILHAPFPNWKYVFLATIAGLFYGHVWMKTGSLFPGALMHALVDISWHLLFR